MNMNEKTAELINEILQKGIKAAEITGDFAIEQAPEVIQQLLLWKGIHSFVEWFFIGVVMGVLNWWVLTKKELPYLRGKDGCSDNWEFGPILIINVLCAFLSLAWLFGSNDWLKIWVAPKLFLLEYAASLVK